MSQISCNWPWLDAHFGEGQRMMIVCTPLLCCFMPVVRHRAWQRPTLKRWPIVAQKRVHQRSSRSYMGVGGNMAEVLVNVRVVTVGLSRTVHRSVEANCPQDSSPLRNAECMGSEKVANCGFADKLNQGPPGFRCSESRSCPNSSPFKTCR